jgi:hypothetical protein
MSSKQQVGKRGKYEIDKIPCMPFTKDVAAITPCYVKTGDMIYPLILEYDGKQSNSHFTKFINSKFDYICVFGERLQNLCTLCTHRFKCIALDKLVSKGCKEFNIIKDCRVQGLLRIDGELTDLQGKKESKNEAN